MRQGQDDEPVDGVERGQREEQHVPKVEDEENFFIDDILREDAEAVMALRGASGSRRFQVATHFGREHLAHGIHGVPLEFRMESVVVPDVEAVAGKAAVEERVRRVETRDQKDEVEDAASQIDGQVPDVVMSDAFEESHVTVEVLFEGVFIAEDEGGRDVLVDEAGNDAPFRPRPQFIGHEEDGGLNEKEKDDPLIISRPRGVIGIRGVVGRALPAVKVLLIRFGDPIRSVNPTILMREIVADGLIELAHDGLAEVLRGGAQERPREANDQRADGEESKAGIVNADFRGLKVFGDLFGDVGHSDVGINRHTDRQTDSYASDKFFFLASNELGVRRT